MGDEGLMNLGLVIHKCMAKKYTPGCTPRGYIRTCIPLPPAPHPGRCDDDVDWHVMLQHARYVNRIIEDLHV